MPREFLNLEQTAPDRQPERKASDRVIFPHVEAILNLLEKQTDTETEPAKPEIVKEMLEAFFEHGVENSQLFTSEKLGAAFPYSEISTASFTKLLYERATGEKLGTLKQAPQKQTKEFVFTSSLFLKNGHGFTFIEEALHQAIKKIPAALAALKRGEEPESYTIYTLGSPTNEIGTIPRKFTEGLTNKNAFERFGELYAEFVEFLISTDAREGQLSEIYFYGISMGGAFAAETAHQLLNEKKLTQGTRAEAEGRTPHLSVRIDTPPQSSNSKLKKLHIPIGFAKEALQAAATNSYVRATVPTENVWTKQLQAAFSQRGMDTHMSLSERTIKYEVLIKLLDNLTSGVPLPDDVQLTEVVGARDWTMPAPIPDKKTRERRAHYPQGLGKQFVSPTPGHRIATANMGHAMPFLVERNNELNRLRTAARALEALKK